MVKLAARPGPFVAALAVLALTSATLRAADWRDYLKRPISPGSVGLLVEHPQESAVVERWALALRDSDARVRAAAARMANVTNAVGLVPPLLAALDREPDVGAGTEEIRAIAALGGTATDLTLLTTARRLGPWAVRAYAGMLARTRGAQAIDFLATLQLLDTDRESTSRLATGGSQEGPR